LSCVILWTLRKDECNWAACLSLWCGSARITHNIMSTVAHHPARYPSSALSWSVNKWSVVFSIVFSSLPRLPGTPSLSCASPGKCRPANQITQAVPLHMTSRAAAIFCEAFWGRQVISRLSRAGLVRSQSLTTDGADIHGGSGCPLRHSVMWILLATW
jgi:hypothetical protein